MSATSAVEPLLVLHALEDHARELDEKSGRLEAVEDELNSVELEYEEFMGAFEEGLWNRHVRDGEKWPPEKVRERLGRREMRPDLLGRYVGLQSERRRIKDRIAALKSAVEARRSVLSAAKEGLVQ